MSDCLNATVVSKLERRRHKLAGEASMGIGQRRQLFLDAGKAHVFDDAGLALRPVSEAR
jgi:hypothetical protein